MKVNFIANLKNDRGTLVFLCLKNKPLDTYLNNINKNVNNYINKAAKISGMEYNNSSFVDILMPHNSKADRLLLFGIDQTKLKK